MDCRLTNSWCILGNYHKPENSFWIPATILLWNPYKGLANSLYAFHDSDYHELINNSWKIHLYIVSFSYCTNYLLLLIFLCFLLYYDLWSFLFLYMTTEACCSIVVTVGNENPNLQSNEWKVMKIMHAKGKLLGLLSVYIDVCEYCLLGKRKRFSFWTSSQVEPLPYGNLPILLWCLRVAPLNITLNPQSKA